MKECFQQQLDLLIHALTVLAHQRRSLAQRNNAQMLNVFTEIDKESCGDPGTPLYGIREGDSFSNGGILRFECQFGFELIGEKTISCQDNNQWSANIPICICKYEK